MASFVSAFQARFSEQLRVNWSRPQNSTATTEDAALVALANSDVVGEFSKRGILADDTDATHITTAMSGIISRLMFYTQAPGWGEAWGSFKEDLALLAETGPRNRIPATTDSLKVPSTDEANSLPVFDSTQFGRYVSQPPNVNPLGQD